MIHIFKIPGLSCLNGRYEGLSLINLNKNDSHFQNPRVELVSIMEGGVKKSFALKTIKKSTLRHPEDRRHSVTGNGVLILFLMLLL